MSKVSRGLVAVGSLFALTFGMSPAKAETLDHHQLCSPDNPSDFRTTSNNEYFPMRPGQLSVFLDQEGEGEGPVGLQIEVLKQTEGLYKGKSRIVARVIRETEWLDANENGKVDHGEELLEISRNYFADRFGTVCYFGEAVDIFDDGGISHEGSWRADEENSAPGIIMPASPEVGDVYLQEDAPVAMDQAEVITFGTHRSGDFRYRNAMRTDECSLVEHPDGCLARDLSVKWYAPTFGLVEDGGLVLTGFQPGT